MLAIKRPARTSTGSSDIPKRFALDEIEHSAAWCRRRHRRRRLPKWNYANFLRVFVRVCVCVCM